MCLFCTRSRPETYVCKNDRRYTFYLIAVLGVAVLIANVGNKITIHMADPGIVE